jgi:hypothetical protein
MVKEYPWSVPQLRKLDKPVGGGQGGCRGLCCCVDVCMACLHACRQAGMLACQVLGLHAEVSCQPQCASHHATQMHPCQQPEQHPAPCTRTGRVWPQHTAGVAARLTHTDIHYTTCVLQVDVNGKPWPLDQDGKPVV